MYARRCGLNELVELKNNIIANLKVIREKA
jgi:hypothetical protein